MNPKRRRKASRCSQTRSPNRDVSSDDVADKNMVLPEQIDKSFELHEKDELTPMVLPVAPTFFPTADEFCGMSPVEYINKIRPIAEQYGICKIVPPAGWDPPFCVDMNTPKKIETKRQLLHRLQEGPHFDDGIEYTPSEYMQYATELAVKWKETRYGSSKHASSNRTKRRLPNRDKEGVRASTRTTTRQLDDGLDPTLTEEQDSLAVECAQQGECTLPREMSIESLERDYWSIVQDQTSRQTVDYGNDVDTNEFLSGFPFSKRGRSLSDNSIEDPDPNFFPRIGSDEYYRETYWNLNNIPSAPGSILRYVKAKINGINVPWLYFGCLFSTFCWHNEDNYLYSINYHHRGAPKQWYGVPGTKRDADCLERVFRSFLSKKMKKQPDLLHHITTMISPRLLKQGNVPVYKLLQHAGEFVVTFPRAFHGGFSLGPNVGEAVNFATPDWITFGADANERYRQFSRPSVFSHDRLAFTLANHVEELSLRCCDCLADELRRITREEILLRSKLIDIGVRDVSEQIQLPCNRLDQLDEQSADYDDKRLCCHCKHVCFFSAVACECSHSRVSCLRHSHLMCKCHNENRYLMIWCSEHEMTSTLERVEHCLSNLRRKDTKETKKGELASRNRNTSSSILENDVESFKGEMLFENSNQVPAIAPGAIKNWYYHRP
jgi:histone demethylase JARID1